MKRREWLQAAGAGLLWPLASLYARGSNSLFPMSASELEPHPTVTDTETSPIADWRALWEPARSCCIGLGGGAEHFIRTLKSRTDIQQVTLMAEHAREPQAVTQWLRQQPQPGDYMIVIIDASDPQALVDLAEQTPLWRPPKCVYCFAVVINRSKGSAVMPWETTDRAALDRAFNVLVEPAPGTTAAQFLAVQLLIDGALLLTGTIIGYDPGDIRECLNSGGRTRRWHTAVTLWNHPAQRERALERLRQRGLAHPAGDMLAFLNAGPSLEIGEFCELMEELGQRLHLGDETGLVTSAFVRHDWPHDRRVLGVTG